MKVDSIYEFKYYEIVPIVEKVLDKFIEYYQIKVVTESFIDNVFEFYNSYVKDKNREFIMKYIDIDSIEKNDFILFLKAFTRGVEGMERVDKLVKMAEDIAKIKE